jgi:type II secretory pathway component PulF
MTNHHHPNWALPAGNAADASAAVMDVDNGFLRVKDPQQRALLRVLAFAHHHRVDPAPLVARLASEYKGRESDTLRQVAYLLISNVPPLSALEQTRGAVDETTLLALRLAEQTGTLARTYQLCLRDDYDARIESDDPSYSPTMELLQRAMAILVACTLLSFLALFIAPTFLKMLEEFGLEVPLFPMRMLRFYESFGFLLVLLSLATIAWFMVFALWMRKWQWKPWKQVYFDGPASVRFRALLAMVVGSGRPVASALETLTKFHCSAAIRNRLATATKMIDNGDAPWVALANNKLLTAREADSLMLAPDRSTEYWLLQKFALSKAYKSDSLRGIALQAISFFLLVVLAIVVGLTAISFFMVLCQLIAGLT